VSFARRFHVTFQALFINTMGARHKPDLVWLAQKDDTRSEVSRAAKIDIVVFLGYVRQCEDGRGSQSCILLQINWQSSTTLNGVITQKNTIWIILMTFTNSDNHLQFCTSVHCAGRHEWIRNKLDLATACVMWLRYMLLIRLDDIHSCRTRWKVDLLHSSPCVTSLSAKH
jgi:hypothetical protein